MKRPTCQLLLGTLQAHHGGPQARSLFSSRFGNIWEHLWLSKLGVRVGHGAIYTWDPKTQEAEAECLL